MPSQVLFLVDLDRCSRGGEEELWGLRRVMLGLLGKESRMGGDGKSELGRVALRFYSSTGYYSLPEQCDYEFREYSEESLRDLDSGVCERLYRSGGKGGSEPVSSLRSALQVLSLHYNWNPPLLDSPLKATKSNYENFVYIMTQLPRDKREYRKVFNRTAKSYTQKELSDALFSKSVLTTFREGNNGLSLYLIDVSPDAPFKDTSVPELFHKTIRSLLGAGGVLSFESLLKQDNLQEYLRAYENIRLKDPIRYREFDTLGRSSFKAFPLGNYSEDTYGKLEFMGYIPSGYFPFSQLWERHFSLKSLNQNIFSFLKREDAVLLCRLGPNFLGILAHGGVLSVLNEKESNFYFHLFGLSSKSFSSSLPQNAENVLLSRIERLHIKDTSIFHRKEDSETFRKRFSSIDLESRRIPDPLKDVTERLKKAKKCDSEWIRSLRSSYLPKHPLKEKNVKGKRIFERNDSGYSEGKKSSVSNLNRKFSEDSSGRQGRKLYASRAAELLRLGNKRNAENKIKRSSASTSKTIIETVSNVFNDQTKARRLAFEKEMDSLLNSTSTSDSTILAKLMELQINCINDGDDVSMTALADITVTSLLGHLQNTGGNKANLVNLIVANFLVDPLTVSRRKTSMKMTKRLCDHKLQVLYRMELHWLATSPEQEKFENEILVHLRQISIWGSPEKMVEFLNEVLTPVYIDRQPELLCSLYDELNQPKVEALRGIFSPSGKSDCSSVAPSSVLSHSSETSFNSNINPKSSSNKSVLNVKRLKRPNSFDLGLSKRQIPLKSRSVKTTARLLAKKPTCNIRERQASVLASPSSKGRAGLHRAKRNLSFDSFGKSPKKNPVTPKKKSETPKKKQPLTPKRMTPNKTHVVYAPETPTSKVRSRKSDGFVTIKESPDIDSIKACKTTPRRMRASLSLHKKTSFYSGHVSRNLMKAKENVNASRIQNISRSQSLMEDSDSESRKMLMFPHLTRKRSRSISDGEGSDDSRYKIRKLNFEVVDENSLDMFTEESPLLTETPKKHALRTPVKGSPSPSKRVQFDMRHQPPTSCNGTPAKTILKTPLKGSETPLNRLLSPLFVVSPRSLTKPSTPCRRGSLKKKIVFHDSPPKPRLLCSLDGELSTKKKIDFNEILGDKKEILINDTEITRVARKTKPSFDSSRDSFNNSEEEEMNPSRDEGLPDDPNALLSPVIGTEKPINLKCIQENENVSKSKEIKLFKEVSDEINASSMNLEALQSAGEVKKETSTSESNVIKRSPRSKGTRKSLFQATETDEITGESYSSICPIENTMFSELQQEFKDIETPKRISRTRKITQRLGIDDVPSLSTPSPTRDSPKLDKNSSASIRRSLFDSKNEPNKSSVHRLFDSEEVEVRKKTIRKRAPTQRLGIDDITLNETISPRRTRLKRKGPVQVRVNVDEPKMIMRDILSGTNTQQPFVEDNEEVPKFPADTWSVSKITESPRGEIILTVNRTPSFYTQRISRSRTSEMGVSPEKIRQFLMKTPSPNRKVSKKENSPPKTGSDQPNFSKNISRNAFKSLDSSVGETSSPSIQKFSPLSSMGLIQLTTSPLLDNKLSRKKHVNKRLYIDKNK